MSKYIAELSTPEQLKIKQHLENKLRREGYTGLELNYWVQIGMDSKISDIN